MKSSTDFIIIGAAILDVLAHPINTVVFENDSYPAEHVVILLPNILFSIANPGELTPILF